MKKIAFIALFLMLSGGVAAFSELVEEDINSFIFTGSKSGNPGVGEIQLGYTARYSSNGKICEANVYFYSSNESLKANIYEDFDMNDIVVEKLSSMQIFKNENYNLWVSGSYVITINPEVRYGEYGDYSCDELLQAYLDKYPINVLSVKTPADSEALGAKQKQPSNDDDFGERSIAPTITREGSGYKASGSIASVEEEALQQPADNAEPALEDLDFGVTAANAVKNEKDYKKPAQAKSASITVQDNKAATNNKAAANNKKEVKISSGKKDNNENAEQSKIVEGAKASGKKTENRQEQNQKSTINLIWSKLISLFGFK